MRLTLALSLSLLALPAVAQDHAAIPYPVIKVPGVVAQAEWHQLRDEPGTPVIIGDVAALANLADTFSTEWVKFYPDSPEQIIAAAQAVSFPEALYDLRRQEFRYVQDLMREEGNESRYPEDYDPVALPRDIDLGNFPLSALSHFPPQNLVGITDWRTDRPFAEVYIVILPTENPWEAPAYLRFGGWNFNPPPEVHVAALRQWHRDYGAEPAVINGDQMELWVPRQPRRWDHHHAGGRPNARTLLVLLVGLIKA